MPITLKCSCGKTLKVDEKHLGKKAKCSECGASILIQQPETAVSEKPKRRPQPVDDASDGDADEDSPKKRKPVKRKAGQKSSMMTWMLVGGCGLLSVLGCLTIGGAVGVYFWFFNTPEDLNYVYDGVTGFVTVRASDAWKNKDLQAQLALLPGDAKKDMDKEMAEMEAKLGSKLEDLERATLIFRSSDLKKKDIFFVLRTSKPMDRKKIIATIAKEQNLKEKEVKHEGATLIVFEEKGDSMALYFPSDRTVVVAETESNLKDVINKAKKSAKHAALTRGLSLVNGGKHHVVAAFQVTKSLTQEMVPGPVKDKAASLSEVNGFILAGTLEKELALEMILTYASNDVAGKAKTEADKLKSEALEAFKAGPGAMIVPPTIVKMFEASSIEQRGAEVVVKTKVDLDLKGLGPMLPFGAGGGGGGGGGPRRIQSINNLKQIGLAMHSHQDIYKFLPSPATLHPQTKQPLLSWRVSILPFIEEDKLYKQIKLNEPWDSPHNKQFHNRMPKVYQLPGKPNDGKTYYQVFQGNESAFPMFGPPTLFGITDGTSNTMFVVEAANAVNWMQPVDILVVGQNPNSNAIGNHWGDNSFHAMFGDASVRRMNRGMPPNILRAFMTRQGGEAININEWEAK